MTVPQFLIDRQGAGDSGVSCESIAQLLRLQSWGFESHAHSTYDQFFWINKGSGRIQVDGQTRGFGPNTAVFVPAGTVHGFDFTPVSAGWVITLKRPLSVPAPLPDFHVQIAVNQREEQAVLTAICDEINREQSSDAPGQGAALACQAGLLAVWLVRHITRDAADPPKENATRRLMRRFVHLLEERYPTQDTVSHYADRLSVTPTHLTRVCRQTAGKPATTVIQDRTLFEARQRLAFTDEKINRVASSLGFASSAYFTRLFTQRTGLSPSEFRREARTGTAPVGGRARIVR